MNLYLIRHGEAAEPLNGGESQLTAKGKEVCAKNGLLLKQLHPNLTKIYHSPKLRALETAMIFHEILGHKILLSSKEGLKPNDPPEPLIDELAQIEESVMIVSHLPFLEKVASILLYGKESSLPFDFEGGSVVILQRKNSRHWQLIGLINDLVPAL